MNPRSVLRQKTDIPIEYIIFDAMSDDGTKAIIKEYIKESILDGIIPNEPEKAFDLMLKKGTELGLTITNEK